MGGYVESHYVSNSMYWYTLESAPDAYEDVLAIAEAHLDIDAPDWQLGCSQTSATRTTANAISIALVPTGVPAGD